MFKKSGRWVVGLDPDDDIGCRAYSVVTNEHPSKTHVWSEKVYRATQHDEALRDI